MKKLIYALLVHSVVASASAETLLELIDEARSAGAETYTEITRFINAPQGFTTQLSTNSVPKPSRIVAIEAMVTNALWNLNVSLDSAISNGWEWAVARMIARVDAAPNANQTALRTAEGWKAETAFSLYRSATGESDPRADFGAPFFTRVVQTRTPNPSRAEQHLGSAVTRRQIIKADLRLQ